MHENLRSVQNTLKGIEDKRKREQKEREEKESNEDPTEKKNEAVQNHAATTD